MKKIIRYEVTKFFTKRKNKLLFLLLFAYIIFINVYNYQMYKTYNDKIIEQYKLIAANSQSERDFLQLDLLLYSGMSEEQKHRYNERIEVLEKRLNYLNPEVSITSRINNALSKADDPEWNRLLCKYLGERYTNIIDSHENGYIDDYYLRERKMNIEEAKHYKYKYNYLSENNIQLMLNEYEPSGSNTILLFLKENSILIIILIVALLSMDTFLSSSMEGSYKLEYTQPFRRERIYWGKIISSFIIIIGILIFMILLSFIINSIIFGIRDFSYPHVVSATIKKLTFEGNQDQFIMIPLSSKLILGFLMMVTLIFLTIALIFFLSILTDSMEKTLGISIVIVITAFTFNIIASRESIVNLIYPYMYCFYENTISGFYRANYLLGITMNISLGTAFILLSFSKFVKKDFVDSRA